MLSALLQSSWPVAASDLNLTCGVAVIGLVGLMATMFVGDKDPSALY